MMLTPRQAAFVELLSQPDPADLRSEKAGRGHLVTCPGDPRRRELIAKQLATAFLQHHFLAKDAPPYLGPARRRADRVRPFQRRA